MAGEALLLLNTLHTASVLARPSVGELRDGVLEFYLFKITTRNFLFLENLFIFGDKNKDFLKRLFLHQQLN